MAKLKHYEWKTHPRVVQNCFKLQLVEYWQATDVPGEKNSDLLHSSVGRELTGQVSLIQLEEHCKKNDAGLK